ncbi:hypothetical protein [Cytophaga aurantiaca]|uniref:hypothetical protein n=1 Tax=Cytophaga aurantiaca TaxID=29530 RepID=UPI0003A1D650|nr:hypothetical protein [Cytophaga aurantiaca]
MKKIYCLILFTVCSQAYGQIHLDSATYYSLIMKGVWIEEEVELEKNVELNDSLITNEINWSRMRIDSKYYWSQDSQMGVCLFFPLKYELQIKNNIFIMHIKDTYLGMEFDFYFYGWFVNDSTMRIIESRRRVKFSKIKEEMYQTYKNYTFKSL